MKRGRLVRQVAIECDPDDSGSDSVGARSSRTALDTFKQPNNAWNSSDDVTSPDDSSLKFLKSNESDGPALFKPRPVLETIKEMSGPSSQASKPCSAEIDGRADSQFTFSDSSPLATNSVPLVASTMNDAKFTRDVTTGKTRVVVSRSDTVVHISKDQSNNNNLESYSTESSSDDECDNNNEKVPQSKTTASIHNTLPNDMTETNQSDLSSPKSAFENSPGKKSIAKALGIKCDMDNRKKHLWARIPSSKNKLP